jgi:hypothetical protein
MAGYSGTPLAKKLGVVEGTRVLAVDAPTSYEKLLAPLPKGVTLVARAAPGIDVVHAFVTKRAKLVAAIEKYTPAIAPDGALWISWPKKSSGVATDVTEDTIREEALPRGLVDVKVCAVDETWSGLKLVIRKENRTKKR